MTSQKFIYLAPEGRLDAGTAVPLQTELQEQLTKGNTRLLIDFEKTRYVSSHALRILLAAHKQASQQGGALKLCGLNPRVREIIQMAGFDTIFEIFGAREEAEKSF
jgi:anti-anti-sigma factor